MNFYNVLKDYKFDNVGQFNAIARSMGYEVELKGDKFIYRNGKEEETMHIKYIRNNMQPYENGEIKDASRERVSNIFNKDRANDASYIKELEKHNISVIRWENIKGENKDGFTIVDHDLKICYTGQSLYEYASQHGKLLDGKGTRLEKGILSDLMDINGKQGKMRFNENGISVFFRKEVLTIPNEILGKKLSHREKELLLAGDIVPISRNGRDYPKVNEDGKIGESTINSYKKFLEKRGTIKGCEMIIKLIDAQQGTYYMSLKRLSDFTVGWVDNRIGNIALSQCEKYEYDSVKPNKEQQGLDS